MHSNDRVGHLLFLVYYKIYSICGLNNSNQKDSEKINFILNNIRDYVSVSESEEEIENFIKECIKNIDFSKYNFEKDFVEKCFYRSKRLINKMR